MLRALFASLLVLLLGACSRGPDSATLQADLQRHLQQAFGKDLLSIVELQRRGSASDANAPAGETRLVIYFDSTLKVERDQDFGSWDSPGVASLVSTLGAGPRGLSGIQTGGNRQGDLLKAHGSLIYRQDQDGWHSVVAQGFSAPHAAQPSENGAGPTHEQLVAAIGTALHLAPGGSGPREQAIISDELDRSLSNIQGRLSRLQQGYPLAGGPAGGQYARFALALQEVLKNKGVELQPLTTAGGVDNLRMLRRGDAVLALSQSDTAHLAINGAGPFAGEGPDLKLRAIASLYPEALHVLVQGGGPLQSMADLRGKRVNLGQPGSASRDTALAVLAAHGLQPGDLAEAAALDLQQGLAALRDGKLDALIQVIGAPADNIRSASESLDLRLLPLQADAIQRVQQQRPGCFAYRLPSGTYPQQAAPVPTLAVSSLLLANEQLTSREAEQLVHELFSLDSQWLRYGSIQGTQLSAGNALRGLNVPLHDGAEQALQQLKPPAG